MDEPRLPWPASPAQAGERRQQFALGDGTVAVLVTNYQAAETARLEHHGTVETFPSLADAYATLAELQSTGPLLDPEATP